MPKKAMTHIQNTAPGPPAAKAVATPTMEPVPKVEAMVGQAELILGNLETATQELADMDVAALIQQMQSLLTNLDSLVSNVDTLVTTNQDGLVETLEKISAIDIETLNKAIKDLSAVIEPLAKFFSAFH